MRLEIGAIERSRRVDSQAWCFFSTQKFVTLELRKVGHFVKSSTFLAGDENFDANAYFRVHLCNWPDLFRHCAVPGVTPTPHFLQRRSKLSRTTGISLNLSNISLPGVVASIIK